MCPCQGRMLFEHSSAQALHAVLSSTHLHQENLCSAREATGQGKATSAQPQRLHEASTWQQGKTPIHLLAVYLRSETICCWLPAALSQRDPDPDPSDGPSRHASRGGLTTGFLLGKQRPLEYLQVRPVAQ